MKKTLIGSALVSLTSLCIAQVSNPRLNFRRRIGSAFFMCLCTARHRRKSAVAVPPNRFFWSWSAMGK